MRVGSARFLGISEYIASIYKFVNLNEKCSYSYSYKSRLIKQSGSAKSHFANELAEERSFWSSIRAEL